MSKQVFRYFRLSDKPLQPLESAAHSLMNRRGVLGAMS